MNKQVPVKHPCRTLVDKLHEYSSYPWYDHNTSKHHTRVHISVHIGAVTLYKPLELHATSFCHPNMSNFSDSDSADIFRNRYQAPYTLHSTLFWEIILLIWFDSILVWMNNPMLSELWDGIELHIHSQTWTVTQLNFRNVQVISSYIYDVCNHLFMLGFKLTNICC